MPKIELLNIDCMEYMAGLPDKAFDLAIVDPPYGIGEGNEKNKTRSSYTGFGDKKTWVNAKDYGGGEWDHSSPDEYYFKELIRVSKNQIIWGANHFISKIPFDSSCWLVWDKNNGECDQADAELAYTSFTTAVRKYTFKWQGLLQQDMKNKEVRIHPTQKPVQLYRWILTNYAKEGNRILDTHLGSGSSAIAAYRENIDFVGCEIDCHYYDAAVNRFNIHKQQGVLF